MKNGTNKYYINLKTKYLKEKEDEVEQYLIGPKRPPLRELDLIS